MKPWEDCGYGYEWYARRWDRGEISDEEWKDWYSSHCGRCKYFSGYHCAEEDIREYETENGIELSE